ncbi:MAG: malonate decarboxylase acyl carrier protein [Janthinobacterium lividum]
MLTLDYKQTAKQRLAGTKAQAIIGVVASGNLEILLERVLPGCACEVQITTPVKGFDATWQAVVAEFVERSSPGGLRISVNDGGARPDTVFLRLMQGCALMEQE